MPACGRAFVHNNDGITLETAGAGRQLGELPRGELGGLGVGLQLLAKITLGLGLRAAVVHDEFAESQDGLAVEPTLLGQARERRAGESAELREVLEVLLLDGDLLLKPFCVGLQFLLKVPLGPDLLPRVVLDGAGPKARC